MENGSSPFVLSQKRYLRSIGSRTGASYRGVVKEVEQVWGTPGGRTSDELYRGWRRRQPFNFSQAKKPKRHREMSGNKTKNENAPLFAQ